MTKGKVSCLFLLFLILLHFLPKIPFILVFVLDIFSIFFIIPSILREVFYKISLKLFLSYFLIGFVPLLASFILLVTIIELGGILYLQNQFEFSLKSWSLAFERDLLNLYIELNVDNLIKWQEKYPKAKLKIYKNGEAYLLGLWEGKEILEENGWEKGEFIYSKRVGNDIIANIPFKEILKQPNFFNIDMDWAILKEIEGGKFFETRKEKNIFKKPIIYSLYTLKGKKREENGYFFFRTSIYSLYKSFVEAQPVIGEGVIRAIKFSSFFLLILTLISFSYAGLLIYKTSKNISMISKGVNYFSLGNLDYRINVKGRDELSTLSKNFNQMAESINLYISKLKEKAEEEKELQLASIIQKSLFPKEEKFSKFKKINLHFVPSKAIGGDYFDIFCFEDKDIFLIGDASGHGISASILMAMTKAIITSLIYRNTPPSCLLPEVHSIILKTGIQDQYITLQVVEILRKEKVINLYNAGHPPPFLIKRDRVIELRLNSFPIGIFDGPSFDLISTPYEEGDFLLFYTDGLLEIEGAEFGLKELKLFLEESLKEKETLFENLLQKIDKLISEGNLIDDLSIVFLKI